MRIARAGDEVSDLPLAERGRLLSQLATDAGDPAPDRPQTWRLGEAMRRILDAEGVAITMEYASESRTTVCASDGPRPRWRTSRRSRGGPRLRGGPTDTIVVARAGRAGADERWPMLGQAVEARQGALNVYAIPVHADGPSAASRRSTRGTTGPGRGHGPRDVPGQRDRCRAAGRRRLSTPRCSTRSRATPGARGRVVHQATGMVMAQVLLPAEDASHCSRPRLRPRDRHQRRGQRVVNRTINFSSFDVEGD